MSQKISLEPRTFPSRIADLGFTAPLPSGWTSHDLPEEAPDFSTPTYFLPLAIVTAPHAAIVYAFAARPAFDDGTLQDWAVYLLSHNQLRPQALGPGRFGNLPAIVGEAVQESEMGPMRIRFAFLEDGKRLLNVTLSAPEMLADVMQAPWQALLESFTLESPKGPTPGLMPAGGDAVLPPSHSEGGPAAEPATPPPTAGATESPPASPASKPASTLAQHALAEDAASLDPEAKINANLRDRGAGLVPRLVTTNDVMKLAIVASGALLADLSVPYGWHALDDGRRLLVFEPAGRVQIHLHSLPREGRSNAAILDELEAEMRNDYPQPEFARFKLGRIHALGARNIHDGPQALEQYHFLFPGRDAKSLVRARITATPETAEAACDLGQLILENIAFDCVTRPDDPPAPPSRRALRRQAEEAAEPRSVSNGLDLGDNPAARADASHSIPARDRNPGAGAASDSHDPKAWHEQALALEAADQLEAAEELFRARIPYIGYAASIAEMYRNRMHRLQQAGDAEGARAAFFKADQWMSQYAGMATSGGEGAALSLERDDFRAQLVQEYGHDPEVTQS